MSILPITVPAWMVTSAVRYAIGRETAIVLFTCDWLLAHWQEIPASEQAAIQRDVERALSTGRAGHAMDVTQWERAAELWRAAE